MDKVPNTDDMVYVGLGKTELGPSLKKLEIDETRKKLDYAVGI